MIVGCLGDIIFAVFDGYVKTIKDMAQSVSARYTTHQRAGGKALAEFTGTDADTITFDIELSAYLGVAPSKQREILKGMSIITRRCRLSLATKSSAAIGGSSNP